VRFYRGRRRETRRRALTLVILIALGMLLYSLDHALRPAFLAVAETRIHALTTVALNEAVRDALAAGAEYDELIHVQTDTSGRIVLMQPNTPVINGLVADTALRAQAKVDSLTERRVGVRLGQAVGSFLFAGLGPTIWIRCLPVGSVTTTVTERFEGAGINQTRHSLWLEARVRFRLVSPLVRSYLDITTRLPITEAVLIGPVPATYVEWRGGLPVLPQGR
jgi:sporulation protein YunB